MHLGRYDDDGIYVKNESDDSDDRDDSDDTDEHVTRCLRDEGDV